VPVVAVRVPFDLDRDSLNSRGLHSCCCRFLLLLVLLW
jgi:hypothetical protein